MRLPGFSVILHWETVCFFFPCPYPRPCSGPYSFPCHSSGANRRMHPCVVEHAEAGGKICVAFCGGQCTPLFFFFFLCFFPFFLVSCMLLFGYDFLGPTGDTD